jgi:hypothetical protein
MPEDPELNLVREEEDDQDLLTYNEAGVRVAEEIVAERGRLAELQKRRDAGETGLDEAIDRSSLRADRLLEASRRNARQPLNDANFEKFFGFPSKANEGRD